EEGNDRNCSQDVHGQAPFRGEDFDLSPQLESFSYDLGHRIQNFSEVSARFSLDLERRDEDSNIGKRHAQREVFKGVSQGHTQALLLKRDLEFMADGVRQFLTNQFEACGEGVAGTNRSSKKVHGFRELLLKLVESLLALDANRTERHRNSHQAGDQCKV